MSEEQAAKTNNVIAILEKMAPQIQRALPRHLTADRMLRIAVTTLRTTPRLAECDPRSIVSSMMDASALGLEVSGVLGQCWMIPYKSRGAYYAQLQIGYKGLVALALRSGRVSHIQAEVVREGDFFEFEHGTAAYLRHVPTPKRGDTITHAYAVATLSNGRATFAIMTRAEVDSIMKGSKSASVGESPWLTDYPEMSKKTAVRRLCKLLPLSPELQQAVAIDDGHAAPMPATVYDIPVDDANGPDGMPAELPPHDDVEEEPEEPPPSDGPPAGVGMTF